MRKAVISGHSRGLGYALAEHYLRAGWAVFGLARGRADLRPSERHQPFCFLAARFARTISTTAGRTDNTIIAASTRLRFSLTILVLAKK